MKPATADFLRQLKDQFGPVRPLVSTRSLFSIRDDEAFVYTRYSKVYSSGATFFGLRTKDLNLLRRRNSIIALLWDGQPEPLLLPLEKFDPIFRASPPAGDGQIKVQILARPSGFEMYVARAGRHNVQPFLGWWPLVDSLNATSDPTPALGHSQVQTLLGAIGHLSGLDVWIPPSDRPRLDWSLTSPFEFRKSLPEGMTAAVPYLQGIDVVWLRPSSSDLDSLYEIEHSTPIYSGLLRLNDVHCQRLGAKQYTIVSDTNRRDKFIREVKRSTFVNSGLTELCGFMQYSEVYRWYRRLAS